MGLTHEQIIQVKADATNLPFKKEFFDAVVSTDSYNYWGRFIPAIIEKRSENLAKTTRYTPCKDPKA